MCRYVKYQQTISVVLCLVALNGCQKSDDAELTKAKADAEVAKADLAKMQAVQDEAQKKDRKCVVSGELFATTQNGDVKKVAGVSVRLMPVTTEFRNRVTELVKQYHDLSDEVATATKVWESKNPKPDFLDSKRYDEWFKAKGKSVDDTFQPRYSMFFKDASGLLTTTGQETSTNSDGKFHIEVETGPYLLVSGVFSMPSDKLVWCKAIKAEGSDLALSLNQQSAVTGDRMGNTPYAPLEHKILDVILMQIGR